MPLTLDFANVSVGLSNHTNTRIEQLTQSIDEKELHTFTGEFFDIAQEACYELTAVVIHVGTLESGHYYCLKRLKNDKHSASTASVTSLKSRVTPCKDRWVMCNDEKVLEISEEDVLAQARGTIHPFDRSVSSNAYMLFYSRISDKKE